MRRRARVWLVVGLLLAGGVPAAAQETREEALAAERAEKATRLHPYEPDPVERRMERLSAFLTRRPAVYTFLGSAFPGGWLAVGPGYRTSYGDSGTFDAHAAWSLKNYKVARAALKLPDIGRVSVALDTEWLDAPKVAFYGLGNESTPADKTSFLYRTTTAGASAGFKPNPILTVGGGMHFLDISTGAGRAGTSIENHFTVPAAPGLGASPTYLRSDLFAEVDSRTSPGYTRRGGLYRVAWSNYHQTSAGPYAFRQLDAQVDQFIPLLRENWVIALRALVSTTDTDAGNAVPYFLMPQLGGGSELRGYPSWRFRDRNRMLLSGEYRWMAGQFVDMALFVDAGKVAARTRDLDFNDLRTSYGIGVRFHTPLATVTRFELARTREGTGLVLSFGPSF
jgi:hypothetical protein